MEERDILLREIGQLKEVLRTDFRTSFSTFQTLVWTKMSDPDLMLKALLLGSEVNDFFDLEKSPADVKEIEQELARRAIAILDAAAEVQINEAELAKIKAKEHSVRAYFLSLKSEKVIYRAENITKDRASFSIKPISFELKLGEITSVIGKNGNGKSTLLKMVAGIISIDEGKWAFPEFCEQSLDWKKIKSKIAFISQSLPDLGGVISLKEHLHFVASSKGIFGQENERAVAYILERLGLSKYQNSSWTILSDGFKFRFELARQLVWSPKLLIMDEPLANLDVKTQAMLLSDLRNLTDSIKYPISIIMSSQNLYEIEKISDNIIFLNDGQAVYNGSAEGISAKGESMSYLLDANCSLEELRAALSDLSEEIIQIKEEQQEKIIQTTNKLTQDILLTAIIAAKVEFKYFRNISNSSRLFFENE
ncbi:ATP-binding cassette domain-containing protein [Pedobacter ghigonis]|uniref:ATP-binding cassette domain-containing protein n=1 Tax=Pedobacter ghigonis TaxID=2730403 RepID=UPI00158A84E8|nr:ABC transporter ATP-binding protein [Pedobacter ghigonis]